ELTDLMLRDSGHIQEADIEYLNRKRVRRGEAPVEPLYTAEDAAAVAPLLKAVTYGEAFEPIPGVTARLWDAGHILGSAGMALDIDEKGRKFRLWFSGDIGRYNLPLLPDPVVPESTEYLIMESTYGDKPHREPQQAYAELREVVRRTIQRGGKVIIPAFAVGRTQELVYSLNRMISGGELPAIPVFVDSPLAVNASKVFRRFHTYFDAETRQFERSGRHPALEFDGLTYTQSVEESKALNNARQPMVIISASGMAENGRILHHLRNNIENPRNTIVIVSWQAPHTLGRRLADREPRVRIFGEEFPRRAEVVTIGGFSAHADQGMLLKYAAASRRSLKAIMLVHGEPRAAGALCEQLREQLDAHIHYPEPKESIEI
ncbi:MAG: MBL fold metallo-hydrolase, partial [Anaerolineaceae bacterium]|nr:MBL fold metallo-hydrolase [Anaerolineaceae bacterium]